MDPESDKANGKDFSLSKGSRRGKCARSPRARSVVLFSLSCDYSVIRAKRITRDETAAGGRVVATVSVLRHSSRSSSPGVSSASGPHRHRQAI